MKILVTGASGFLGRPLCDALVKNGDSVTAVVRSGSFKAKEVQVYTKELNAKTHWQDALNGIDIVMHLAGRAHVINEMSLNPEQEYQKVNVDVTQRLAEEAVKAGVKRFIFVSSVKVSGERTNGAPFKETDTPQPEDAYGRSKEQAEQLINAIAKRSKMGLVIVRPPLIYGEGVKGNFKKLIQLCRRGIPLPLGAIHNKRSFIYIDNLIDFLMLCTHHQSAINQTFLVSDDEDVSTTALIQAIIKAGDYKTCLLAIPQSLLTAVFLMLGKHTLSQRLCGDLQVDISKAKQELGWVPPVGFKAGVLQTVRTLEP